MFDLAVPISEGILKRKIFKSTPAVEKLERKKGRTGAVPPGRPKKVSGQTSTSRGKTVAARREKAAAAAM